MSCRNTRGLVVTECLEMGLQMTFSETVVWWPDEHICQADRASIWFIDLVEASRQCRCRCSPFC